MNDFFKSVSQDNTTECNEYNPDKVFQNFKLIEFPLSFVGLYNSIELDLGIDVSSCAYLKTFCSGDLIRIEDARNLSAPHRSFEIISKTDKIIGLTFKPTSECIAKAKLNNNYDNRFVIDLRVIQINELRCCGSELHAEIGRYYISGQFEYLELTQIPYLVDFGDVMMNSKEIRKVKIFNKSHLLAAKVEYIRTTSFEIIPNHFFIPPNSSKIIIFSFKPVSLHVKHEIKFKITNPSNKVEIADSDSNYLTHFIPTKFKILLNKKIPKDNIESLHKLIEKDNKYTYLEDELHTMFKRKEKANEFLEISKTLHIKKTFKHKVPTGNITCDTNVAFKLNIHPKDFCNLTVRNNFTTFETLNIIILPIALDFGRIGLNSYAEQEIFLQNNTKYDVTIKFYEIKNIHFTAERLKIYKIKVKSFGTHKVSIFCFGSTVGCFTGYLIYSLENKYHKKHSYKFQVGNPALMIKEKSLKFGMINSENFVSAVPVRLFNFFNVPVDFQWAEIHPDTPFEIIPKSGRIPKHSCKICDVMYICSQTKTKTYEVECKSISKIERSIHLELSVVTRKLSIKFLQPSISFKEIPLNLEIVERVKLENSSREIAFYHVIEPLIPGFKITPMCGFIRPKMIMTFEISVKIACVLEFNFDIYLKINNKENVVLPVSGNVVEPKVVIHPKNIYLSRVPCEMITYVPVSFHNISTLRSVVEVLDTGDENIFNVYGSYGNEKQRVYELIIEGGQTKTVYIKVCDTFRREYEMYLPFQINELLGPPNKQAASTELQHYTKKYEQLYENNSRVKIQSFNKDISYCRISGVITVPWIDFTVEKFEVDFFSESSNSIAFKMINISKYNLPVSIVKSKLSSSFSLELISTTNETTINESYIKFLLECKQEAEFLMTFHPDSFGTFLSTAVLFLDKHMTLPYYNLTFIGKKQRPVMTPSKTRIILAPCRVDDTITNTFTLKFEGIADLNDFSIATNKVEPYLDVVFSNRDVVEEDREFRTIISVQLSVCCKDTYSQRILLMFSHISGSGCDVELSFCFTCCPLTLHACSFVTPETNPFPYYPLDTCKEYFEYLERCNNFLETWMFQQGFRRDLFPQIPDTFHAISSSLSSQANTKTKGINVSYMNFLKRIAGPLVKHLKKEPQNDLDDSIKIVKEIYDTYKEIITLIKSRGGNVWSLEAKYLLSHDQFIIYCQNETPSRNIDIIENRTLASDIQLFQRLNKQCWFDFIIQAYKVFVFDSCFFECVCVSALPRDTIKVIVNWYNSHIASSYYTQIKKIVSKRTITNLTTDLVNGTAIMAAIVNYCPFLREHFSIFCEVKNNDVGDIIHNACLIIEAMNQLRLFFPLTSTDFIEPNFIQMLFLSVHLYVTLPMFTQKDIIEFSPPISKSSTRLLSISPTSQEPLTYNYTIINTQHNFTIEKSMLGENGKKNYLSIKYQANFVEEQKCVLLVHGYNKSRIFDTYMIFLLYGRIGSLQPLKKCKVSGHMYKPSRVDVTINSPFSETSEFGIFITDVEPTLPVSFKNSTKPKFCVKRLHLLDKEITLSGVPKEAGQDVVGHKLYLQMICLSNQAGNSWIWFKSAIGEFYVKVTSQPRWDIATETIPAKLVTWPMDPCSCGESCDCYRTTTLIIPHRVDAMVKSLRSALMEMGSATMLNIFDQLIETTTGKIILGMLLNEGGTDMSEMRHILKDESTFRVTSKTLSPRLDKVTLAQHSSGILVLPVTLAPNETAEKHSITLTSECGMDVRVYRIILSQIDKGESSSSESKC